jgi:DNA-binding CsgD family transcriptional regulator
MYAIMYFDGVKPGLWVLSEEAVAVALEEDVSPVTAPDADRRTLSVVEAYEVASAPPSSLTPREHEIAALIATGRSNKAIAAELSISPTTAARHVANILAKLGFRSRTQIAAWMADRPSQADGPTEGSASRGVTKTGHPGPPRGPGAPRPGREPGVSDGPAR